MTNEDATPDSSRKMTNEDVTPRSPPVEPRAVKRRPKEYDRLNKPRQELRQALLRKTGWPYLHAIRACPRYCQTGARINMVSATGI